MPEAPVFRSVLKTYPHTAALKSGALTSPEVVLDFQDVEPVHDAFSPMVRERAYDLCELAIVTVLQAVAYGAPVIVLPAVIASRFQRPCLISYADRGLLDPRALADKRIGVRAYTQTTGLWVRSHLFEDYGLPIDRMDWVTQVGAHVEAYKDPPNVTHAPPGAKLLDMLRSSDVDAVIMGNDLPKGPEWLPVIPDAEAKDLAWWRKHGFMPINHMVVVDREVANREPEAVRAAYRLLARAAEAVHAPADAPSKTCFGLKALEGPVAFTLETCRRQRLTPPDLRVEDVLGPARQLLGAEAN